MSEINPFIETFYFYYYVSIRQINLIKPIFFKPTLKKKILGIPQMYWYIHTMMIARSSNYFPTIYRIKNQLYHRST